MTRAPRGASVALGVAVLILGSVAVAIAQPVVEYTDRSSETGLQYSGQPRNAMNVNYNNDQYEDFTISLFGDNTLGFTGDGVSPNGAPVWVPDSGFYSTAPSPGTQGLLAADYDNDGLVDLFACDTDGGAKLYRNGGSGYADVTTASGLATLMGYETTSTAPPGPTTTATAMPTSRSSSATPRSTGTADSRSTATRVTAPSRPPASPSTIAPASRRSGPTSTTTTTSTSWS